MRKIILKESHGMSVAEAERMKVICKNLDDKDLEEYADLLLSIVKTNLTVKKQRE